MQRIARVLMLALTLCLHRLCAETYDVIVIGAGAAGLAAAQDLHREGYQVVVLEARERIGGRIATDRSHGIPIELGAGWINGIQGNPIAAIAKQINAPVFKSQDTDVIYLSAGEKISGQQSDKMEEWGANFFDYVERRQEENKSDASLGSIWDQFSPRIPQNLRRVVRARITAEVEHDYAADLQDLSLYYFNQDEELLGGDALLPQGFDRVLEPLAKNLKIQLREVVQSIDYSKPEVVIRTNKGVYRAAAVICTLPLGVLKQGTVTFTPVLPPKKLEAIQRLNMGVLDKVILHFPNAFWDKQAQWIFHVPKQGLRWIDFLNLYPMNQQPVLVAFNAGRTAVEMEAWNDSQTIKGALDVLKTIYGTQVPDPDWYYITRWQKDPFAFGSYSSIPPGGTGKDYEELAKPLAKRLFFAGEATYRAQPGTVQGAYLSGLRAAKEARSSK